MIVALVMFVISFWLLNLVWGVDIYSPFITIEKSLAAAIARITSLLLAIGAIVALLV